MCKCNPSIKTPYCGAIGCEYPKIKKTKQQLVEEIKQLECDLDDELDSIRRKYEKIITELRNQCDHIYDHGGSSLVAVAGHPWHSGWDKCTICEKYIETNEYGRD